MKRIVLVSVLVISFTAGCNKKPKETVPDSAPPPVDKTATGRSATPPPPVTNSGGGGPSSGGLAGGRINGGGGGGGVFSAYKAARRTEAINEMKTLGQLISLLQNDLGRMPTKDQIMAEVMKTDRKLFTALNEGAFLLTGTTEAGGLWAYEVDADKIPGIALIGGTATRSTPEDLKQYFRGN